MTVLFALAIGALYAASFYMILRRSVMKLVMGLILLGQASNLLIFVVGGLKRGSVPILAEDGSAVRASMPDPLPQALILTAIVISFGVLAFFLILAYRTYRITGTDDSDTMKEYDA